MKAESQAHDLIPPALLEQLEAMAAAEHRPARDMLREAVERYLRERRALAAAAERPFARELTPREAVARILELRKGNVLPEGVTIRDLMSYGRA
jgi:predicted DNA-binding protein